MGADPLFEAVYKKYSLVFLVCYKVSEQWT